MCIFGKTLGRIVSGDKIHGCLKHKGKLTILMSSAHNSPEAKSNKDSPLSLLASIISNSPNNDQTVSVETKGILY
jgi:hypothetical protein